MQRQEIVAPPDITDEDFEMPSHLLDIAELIETGVQKLDSLEGKDKKVYRNKLNEIIQHYNDEAKFKCYKQL